MSQYKRCYQRGGNYFFTLVTHERRPIFINPDNVTHLKAAINVTIQRFQRHKQISEVFPEKEARVLLSY